MRRLKIIIISDWFSENMGYAENFLPKALAELGHDVHLVTSTAQIYYSSPDYDKTYRNFLGPNIVDAGIKNIDGYTLHRLNFKNHSSTPLIDNLQDYLCKLKPDIIQTLSVSSLSTYQAAQYCLENNCKLFTECHVHASVFKNESILKKKLSLRIFRKNIIKLIFDKLRSSLTKKKLKFINSVTEICYPIAPDVTKIAINNFFVSENKIKLQSLGVDTSLFHPASIEFIANDFKEFRSKIGLKPDSLVCVYTGRFARDKNPQCLAKAVDYLNKQGENIQAIFVGNGTPDEINEIKEMDGCFVHEFVQVNNLPKFYWISNIGVWPSQESTSQLDAAACGLPLILSNNIKVKERVNGNGLLYNENDEISLAECIKSLKDNNLRKRMSDFGVEKILEKLSWVAISKLRLDDYYKSLLK